MKGLALMCGASAPLLLMVGILLIIFGAFDRPPNGGMTFVGILFVFLPGILALSFWKLSKGTGQSQFEQFVRENISADYSTWFDESGIAMDVSNERIVLAKNKVQKVYSFSDIREWRSSFIGGGAINTFGNVGIAVASNVASANIVNLAKNYLASGLFIRVRDIENPEWQINGVNEKQATYWFEIFEQHLNERRKLST